MADQFMRIGGRGEDGTAKPIETDVSGKIISASMRRTNIDATFATDIPGEGTVHSDPVALQGVATLQIEITTNATSDWKFELVEGYEGSVSEIVADELSITRIASSVDTPSGVGGLWVLKGTKDLPPRNYRLKVTNGSENVHSIKDIRYFSKYQDPKSPIKAGRIGQMFNAQTLSPGYTYINIKPDPGVVSKLTWLGLMVVISDIEEGHDDDLEVYIGLDGHFIERGVSIKSIGSASTGGAFYILNGAIQGNYEYTHDHFDENKCWDYLMNVVFTNDTPLLVAFRNRSNEKNITADISIRVNTLQEVSFIDMEQLGSIEVL